jgi:Tfp pilus assembly protein PilV
MMRFTDLNNHVSMPGRQASNHRRSAGLAMMLVLIAVAVCTVLGLSFLAHQNAALAVSQNIDHHAQARHIAESGIELVSSYIQGSADWRTARSEGDWLTDYALYGGTCTVTVTDGIDTDGDGVVDSDGDLADDATDPVTLVSTGRFGNVSHRVTAVLEPRPRRQKTIMFIVEDATNLGEQEQARIALLASWGYDAEPISRDASSGDFQAAIDQADAGYIMAGLSTPVITLGLKNVEIGLIVEEPTIASDTRLTTSAGSVNEQVIVVTDNAHHITGDFGIGALPIVTATTELSQVTGSTGEGVRVLAEQISGNPALITIEAGGELAGGGGRAGGRRVLLPWGGATFDIRLLNSNGRLLLKRSLEWACQPTIPGPPIHRWTLDELAETIAFDVIAGVNGEYHNGTQQAQVGIFGTAARFDGADDFIQIPHSDDMLIDEGSVSLWFRPEIVSGRQGLFSKDAESRGTGGHLTLYAHNKRIKVRLDSATKNNQIESGDVLAPDQWTHVVVSFGTSKVRLYINGEFAREETYTGGLGSSSGGAGNHEPIVLGSMADHSHAMTADSVTEPLLGRIDDVRIYDYPLTASHAAALYAEGDPNADSDAPRLVAMYPFHEYIRQPQLVSHWPLNEDSGVIANDITGGNDGQIIGDVQLTETGPTGFGTCYGFDGSAEYVEIPHSDRYLLDEGTITFWFYANDTSYRQGLLSKDAKMMGTGGHLDISLFHGVTARLQSTTGEAYVQSGGLMKDRWYHVSLTFGSSGMRLYLNAVSVNTDLFGSGLGLSSGGIGNYEPIVIGASTVASDAESATPTSYPFTGLIDDVRIYDRKLTPTQIVDVYKSNPLSQSTGPGTMVLDTAGFGQPLNLELQNPYGFSWLNHGGLLIGMSNLICSNQPPDKIRNAVAAHDELTAQVVFIPHNVTLNGPARLVSNSGSIWESNFLLGQEFTSPVARLRTSNTTNDGQPGVIGSNGISDGRLNHLVATYDGERLKMYHNGRMVADAPRTGLLDNWDTTYPLVMANEISGDRPWRGRLYHVSFYDRALNPYQVEDLFRGDSPGDYDDPANITYEVQWLELP